MALFAPRTPSPHAPTRALSVPKAPLWGPRYDDQDVGGSRRSRRSTNNPFSSANNSKAKTPEPRPELELLSPPASPSLRAALSTPKSARGKKTARFASDHLNATSRLDNTSLMLTPAKTPRNTTPPSTGTSRTVVFQHGDPSDAMPTPRKMKSAMRKNTRDLFGNRRSTARESFEIHTDWNARRPTLDLSEDNAFIGDCSSPATIHGRSRTAQPLPLTVHMSDEEMDHRVKNDEGLIFTFRGKKVYRPYEDALPDLAEAEELGYRPIKRVGGRPALLDFARLAAGPSVDTNDTDEEAVTDIEAADDDDEAVGSNDPPSSQSSVLGQQGPGHRSAFASWTRTKPGGAKSARKREVEAEEEAAGTGAVKKAKNLL